MGFYDRQQEMGINTDQTIVVCGTGGIGFHVSKFLAMSGVERLYLFDHDQVEEHNLNRLDMPVEMIGKNKADCVAEFIEQMRPNCVVRAFPFKFDNHLIPTEKVDWLVDCTDVHAAQLKNKSLADRMGAKYCKSGYNGFRFTISDNVAKWDSGNTPDGYTITPSWVVPAVMVAAMTVAKVLKYPEGNLAREVSDLFNV